MVEENKMWWGLAFESAFLAALVWLAWVDIRTHRLPDRITVSLASGGFILATCFPLGFPVDVRNAALGFALGWTAPVVVDQVYRFRVKRPGMGLGDAKLLAAAGVWLGPLVLVAWSVATAGAAIWGWRRRRSEFAFGPWIVGAVVVVECVHTLVVWGGN